MTCSTNLLFLSNLLFILIFQPCSCSYKRNDMVFYLDEEAKKYTVFQSHSYWIYEKMPAGVSDTQILVKAGKEFNQGEFCQPSFEQYSGKGFSSFLKDSFYISLGLIDDNRSSARRTEYIIRHGMQNNYSQIGYFSGNINDSVRYTHSSQAAVKYKEFLPEYQMGANKFYGVKVFQHIPFYFNPADSTLKVFWAKGIGIIRKEYAGGSFDILTKYEVKQ